MTGAKNFDRVADIYDATRGGERRGRRFAADLHPLFSRPGPVFEIGIGTGVVALGLTELGRSVTGIDIGFEMAKRARDRIGPRIALGLAECLPLGTASIDDIYSAWVLQLVDVEAVMREVFRVLRPGGRYVVSQQQDLDPDPIHAIEEKVYTAVGRPGRFEFSEAIIEHAHSAGLVFGGRVAGKPQAFAMSPSAMATHLEVRGSSNLFDLDDARFEQIVVPAIRELRALPDPDEPIECVARAEILIFDR